MKCKIVALSLFCALSCSMVKGQEGVDLDTKYHDAVQMQITEYKKHGYIKPDLRNKFLSLSESSPKIIFKMRCVYSLAECYRLNQDTPNALKYYNIVADLADSEGPTPEEKPTIDLLSSNARKNLYFMSTESEAKDEHLKILFTKYPKSGAAITFLDSLNSELSSKRIDFRQWKEIVTAIISYSAEKRHDRFYEDLLRGVEVAYSYGTPTKDIVEFLDEKISPDLKSSPITEKELINYHSKNPKQPLNRVERLVKFKRDLEIKLKYKI